MVKPLVEEASATSLMDILPRGKAECWSTFAAKASRSDVMNYQINKLLKLHFEGETPFFSAFNWQLLHRYVKDLRLIQILESNSMSSLGNMLESVMYYQNKMGKDWDIFMQKANSASQSRSVKDSWRNCRCKYSPTKGFVRCQSGNTVFLACKCNLFQKILDW